MKPESPKVCFSIFALFCIVLIAVSCKKDQLEVNEVKTYSQVMDAPVGEYGGWSLTLQPDGVADVLPSGDIYYRGTYKISGSKIKVKTPQNSGSYTFEIISQTEIKEAEFGVILKLQ